MAIVQAGKQFTKEQLQQTAGNLAAFIHDHVQDANDFATQLGSWTEADLIDLGLSVPEINAIKGFYIGDLPAITTSVQSSQWIKQLLGLGV